MSRILLVDDSPHAQRIGERILTEEGFEVVTVSTGESALIRLDDVDPDVVVADTVMPGRNGFDICHYLKLSPRHRHARVILTAGVRDTLDEEEVRRVGADSSLRKPFEATALIAAVKPLAEAVAAARGDRKARTALGAFSEHPDLQPKGAAPFVALLDAEQVRAAVTIALDASMANMVEEITRRVLAALSTKRPFADTDDEQPSPNPPALAVRDVAPFKPTRPEPVKEVPVQISLTQPPPVEQAAPPSAPAPSDQPVAETNRRATPARVRSGSILGLELTPVELEKNDFPRERR